MNDHIKIPSFKVAAPNGDAVESCRMRILSALRPELMSGADPSPAIGAIGAVLGGMLVFAGDAQHDEAMDLFGLGLQHGLNRMHQAIGSAETYKVVGSEFLITRNGAAKQ